jgi:hypothetical protein
VFTYTSCIAHPSPDLTPADLYLCGHLTSIAYFQGRNTRTSWGMSEKHLGRKYATCLSSFSVLGILCVAGLRCALSLTISTTFVTGQMPFCWQLILCIYPLFFPRASCCHVSLTKPLQPYKCKTVSACLEKWNSVLICKVFLSIYGCRALCWAFSAFSVSWYFTQLVGLLGRGISPSQGRYLTQTDIHSLSGIRTHDPSVRAGENISCLRPQGHWDRHPRV